MKKAILCLPLLFVTSKVHAVSTGTYTVIWNPYGGHNQYISPASTTTITGGLNITITTTATGVLISASTGSAAGGITVYPATATPNLPFGLNLSSANFNPKSSGTFVNLWGQPFIYTTYTVLMITPGGNLVTNLTDPIPQITTYGYGAGVRLVGASDVTLVGSSSGGNAVSGTDYTGLGTNTLLNFVGGIGYDTCLGSHACDLITTSYYDNCTGVACMGNATGGDACVGDGVNALFNLQPGAYGVVGVGYGAGGFILTGSSDTFTGHLSGTNMGGSSSDNSCYGALSCYNIYSATGIVMVGAIDTPNVVTALQNAITIGWDVQPISSNTAQIGGREGTGKEVNVMASTFTAANEVRTKRVVISSVSYTDGSVQISASPMVFIASASVTQSTFSVSFDGSQYSQIWANLQDIVPQVSSAVIDIRISISGSYLSSGYTNVTNPFDPSVATSSITTQGATSLKMNTTTLQYSAGNGGNEFFNANVYLKNPSSLKTRKFLSWDWTEQSASDILVQGYGGGMAVTAASVVDGILFKTDSPSNAFTGFVSVYGIKK